MGKILDREIRGICLGVPAGGDMGDVGVVVRFIDEWLAPRGCNMLTLLTRYAYHFESHPECAAKGAVSKEGMILIREACKRNNIKLIPKMNLLGHQSGKTRDTLDGLLNAYPEFDETPQMDEVFYCRSLCPNHPGVKPIVFDLMDELVDVCEADAMHIGMDEVFDIGLCDRCKGTPTADIFADWVNALAGHLRERGVRTYMWGDRLLPSGATGYGTWEAAANGTEGAIDKVAKDIFICDWHYEDCEKYGSVEIFQERGFDYVVCPWRYKANMEKFLRYANEHGGDHLKGFMATTWHNSAVITKHILGIEKSDNDTIINLATTLEALFE
ncbi:MAG: family 20 glycosylhydrolase [Oscillospiraceae bacterium]|nr:family 20 glycosylhydrolase [Oscillospiraceae bacterium]